MIRQTLAFLKYLCDNHNDIFSKQVKDGPANTPSGGGDYLRPSVRFPFCHLAGIGQITLEVIIMAKKYRDFYDYLDVASALADEAYVLAHWLQYGETSCWSDDEDEDYGLFPGPASYDVSDYAYKAAEMLLNGKFVKALKLMSRIGRERLEVFPSFSFATQRRVVIERRKVAAQRRRVSRAAAAIAAGECIWRDHSLEERMLSEATEDFGVPLYKQKDTMRMYYQIRKNLGIENWWCSELSAMVDYVLTGYKTLAFEDGFESNHGFYDWTAPCGGWDVDLCRLAVFYAVCCGNMAAAEDVFKRLPSFWTGKSAGHVTVQNGIQRLHEIVENPKCWVSYKKRAGSYYLVA